MSFAVTDGCALGCAVGTTGACDGRGVGRADGTAVGGGVGCGDGRAVLFWFCDSYSYSYSCPTPVGAGVGPAVGASVRRWCLVGERQRAADTDTLESKKATRNKTTRIFGI